jgi:hypothetical protein
LFAYSRSTFRALGAFLERSTTRRCSDHAAATVLFVRASRNDHQLGVRQRPSENEDSARNPGKDQDTQTAADLPSTHVSQVIAASTSGKKQLNAADEIATIIMAALQSIEACPDRAFIVAVYGSNPWNAMLTIRPEAGPSIDRSVWLSRVQGIGCSSETTSTSSSGRSE